MVLRSPFRLRDLQSASLWQSYSIHITALPELSPRALQSGIHCPQMYTQSVLLSLPAPGHNHEWPVSPNTADYTKSFFPSFLKIPLWILSEIRPGISEADPVLRYPPFPSVRSSYPFHMIIPAFLQNFRSDSLYFLHIPYHQSGRFLSFPYSEYEVPRCHSSSSMYYFRHHQTYLHPELPRCRHCPIQSRKYVS